MSRVVASLKPGRSEHVVGPQGAQGSCVFSCSQLWPLYQHPLQGSLLGVLYLDLPVFLWTGSMQCRLAAHPPITVMGAPEPPDVGLAGAVDMPEVGGQGREPRQEHIPSLGRGICDPEATPIPPRVRPAQVSSPAGVFSRAVIVLTWAGTCPLAK